MSWLVKIIENKSSEVVEVMKCDNEKDARETQRGAMINGNTEDFSFLVVEELQWTQKNTNNTRTFIKMGVIYAN